ncbi:MAG: uncharacterized protein A8A55_0421 [Amphiamblys sp. WSBS2006]|nr:MAG: uncharacterized protein A8A55_0421 [Amphiamblys sp. WSBS2006]
MLEPEQNKIDDTIINTDLNESGAFLELIESAPDTEEYLGKIEDELKTEISSKTAPFYSLCDMVAETQYTVGCTINTISKTENELAQFVKEHKTAFKTHREEEKRLLFLEEMLTKTRALKKTIDNMAQIEKLLRENSFEAAMEHCKTAGKDMQEHPQSRAIEKTQKNFEEMKTAIGKALRDRYSEELEKELKQKTTPKQTRQ